MNKKSPMRMCVGCHEMREKREMIRVLKMQDNTFCIDAAGRKNGRGAYLCKKMECLDQAVQNHGLERSFKMSIPKEIIAMHCQWRICGRESRQRRSGVCCDRGRRCFR